MLGPEFLQLYLSVSTEFLENLVRKADENGYHAIVVTRDHGSYRVRDNTLSLFEEASKTIDPELQNSISLLNMNVPDIMVQNKFTIGSITWAKIEWVKKLTTLPIICKGILSLIDAELASKYGADGIVVRFVFRYIQLSERILLYIIA